MCSIPRRTVASRHRLEVIGGGDPIDVDERSHLLAVLQRAEVPIRTSCGGVATCGLCRLTVVEGGEHLTPLREVEVHHLGNVAPILGLRLACQARFAEPGVVRVEVPPPRKTCGFDGSVSRSVCARRARKWARRRAADAPPCRGWSGAHESLSRELFPLKKRPRVPHDVGRDPTSPKGIQ